MPMCLCCMCQCSSLAGLMYHCYYPVSCPNATWQKGKILRISVLRWSIKGNFKLFCIKSLSSTMWPSGALSLACSGCPSAHSSKCTAASSSPHGCSGGACELFSCCFPSQDLFPNSTILNSCWFPVTFWTYASVSCTLQLSFPLLALLWASTWWMSPQHASRCSRSSGGSKDSRSTSAN